MTKQHKDNTYISTVSHHDAIPRFIFFYRVRNNSMIRGITQAKRLVLFSYMSKKYKTLYATFATDLVNLLSANGPGISIDNPTLDYKLTQKIPLNSKTARLIIKTIKKKPGNNSDLSKSILTLI